jgi:serine/threonine protein kinase
MGVVYRARDTRLKRTVALKFLPPELTRDAEAKERFVHEAQAASALQHQNLCVIHDIGVADSGQMFIVMELLDGETLKRKNQASPIGIQEAVTIALQIARGLQRAHDHHIVHRDIKPANIIVTDEGIVKIVDFGLAKLRGQTAVTKAGTTLGTVAYMSPEQARGEDVDHRTDIWALGIVLFEMLTGRVPFPGENSHAVLYGVLNVPTAPPSMLRPAIPPALDRIVMKALTKSPDERYQSIGDLIADLESLPSSPGKAPAAFRTGAAFNRKGRSVLLISGAIISVAAIAFLLWPPHRLEWNPEASTRVLQIPFALISYADLSSDGNWIAFGAEDSPGILDLHLMSSGGGEPKRITSDSAAMINSVAFSEDGSRIAFSANLRGTSRFSILVVPTLGGATRTIADPGLNPTWIPGEDRLSYALIGERWARSPSGKFEIWSVRPDGSDRRREFVDTLGLECVRMPWSFSWSPDARAFVYTRTLPSGKQVVVLRDRASGREREITQPINKIDDVIYGPEGHVLFSSSQSGNMDIWMVSTDAGSPARLTRSVENESSPKLSADGRTLYFTVMSESGELWVSNLRTGASRQLTNDGAWRSGVGISPDGRFLAFNGNAQTDLSNLVMPNQLLLWDRAERRQRVITPGEGVMGNNVAWSPDGKHIAYATRPDTTGSEFSVYVVSPFEPDTPRRLGYGNLPRWLTDDTVGWFWQGKSWRSSIHKVQVSPFYEDSMVAQTVLGGKAVLYHDIRPEHPGVWLDLTPEIRDERHKIRKLVFAGRPVYRIAGDRSTVFLTVGPGKIARISLPGGTRKDYPWIFEQFGNFSVTASGEEIAHIKVLGRYKLVVTREPFR